MFKMLVMQSLYNLSDDQTEYQLRNCLPFQRFLGLDPEATVPDVQTLRFFREPSARHGFIEELFDKGAESLQQRRHCAEGQSTDDI